MESFRNELIRPRTNSFGSITIEAQPRILILREHHHPLEIREINLARFKNEEHQVLHLPVGNPGSLAEAVLQGSLLLQLEPPVCVCPLLERFALPHPFPVQPAIRISACKLKLPCLHYDLYTHYIDINSCPSFMHFCEDMARDVAPRPMQREGRTGAFHAAHPVVAQTSQLTSVAR